MNVILRAHTHTHTLSLLLLFLSLFLSICHRFGRRRRRLEDSILLYVRTFADNAPRGAQEAQSASSLLLSLSLSLSLSLTRTPRWLFCRVACAREKLARWLRGTSANERAALHRNYSSSVAGSRVTKMYAVGMEAANWGSKVEERTRC